MNCVFRYVERVSEMLRQKLKQADILVLKAAAMAERRQETLQEHSRLEPHVNLLAGRTRELQKLVSDQITCYSCSRVGAVLSGGGGVWCGCRKNKNQNRK